MNYLISMAFFAIVTAFAFVFNFSDFSFNFQSALNGIDPPSIAFVIVTSIVFGIGATSLQTMLQTPRVVVACPPNLSKQEVLSVLRFLHVTGLSAIGLSVFGCLIGILIVFQNIDPDVAPFYLTFAVLMMTLYYGVGFMLVCWVAKQRLKFHYFDNGALSSNTTDT